MPINLSLYDGSTTITNKYFRRFPMPDFERIYLPDSVRSFTNADPIGTKELLIDDNRSAVSKQPYMSIDGTDFYFLVKGIGSTTSPFSHQLLKKEEICSLLKSGPTKERITNATEKEMKFPRYLTGELWSRGCPYGSQGLEFASIAMKATEMSDSSTTSIHGFRIAPLVKIVKLPEVLQKEVTQVYVQETRLIPSNIRIYFQSDWTIGNNTGELFDFFRIDENDKAMYFLKNFVKSGIAILTLFVRSMSDNGNGTYSGLDFYDVWLDKDAVLAPDGTIFWADLEGLQAMTIGGRDRADLEFNIEEKMEHQIYRSLYEFIYAYEQIERERVRRFGNITERKTQFEYLLKDALKDDEVVDLHRSRDSLELVIGNILGEEKLTKTFTILDW
ncbi:hypothetical protein E6H37_07015 [Candidatus Bathyarchaeota archaeon]|nr:MAG: hypothetical protein E6H37_07015 [Candidatus Bathyarchaeota archaeon]